MALVDRSREERESADPVLIGSTVFHAAAAADTHVHTNVSACACVLEIAPLK